MNHNWGEKNPEEFLTNQLLKARICDLLSITFISISQAKGKSEHNSANSKKVRSPANQGLK